MEFPDRRRSNLAELFKDSGGLSVVGSDSVASNPSSNGGYAGGSARGGSGKSTPMAPIARVCVGGGTGGGSGNATPMASVSGVYVSGSAGGGNGDATPTASFAGPLQSDGPGSPGVGGYPSLDASSNGRALEEGESGRHSAASNFTWNFERESTISSKVSKGFTSFSEHVAAHTSGVSVGPQASAWSKDFMDFSQYDEQLPITASRSARWYATSFHCVTAMIGAGVLALPYAMASLGWAAGILGLVVCWAVTLYSLWQLCYMHEMDGKRFNRYHELGQYCFGPKLGLWIVVPFQLVVMVGLGIVYALTAGQLLHHVWKLTCSQPCTPFGLSAWISVFCAFQIILSQLPNFNALRVVSFISAFMSICYSTMAIAGSLAHGRSPKIMYHHPEEWTQIDIVFNAFAALGTLSFAYGGHNVVLEIQATLPSPPSSFKPMMKGVYAAYALVAYCYFGVAITGFWAFGNDVRENVLFSVAQPKALMIAADLTVVMHMCGSFQIYSMPVFDMIETLMVRKNIRNNLLPRLVYRTAYVVLLGFIGIAVPFFGDILAVLGAVAYGPTTFLLPSIMYLIQVRPPYRSPHFAASWFNILVGVIVTALGTIGGMRNLIRTASGYNEYFT